MAQNKIKIAIIGSRGYPYVYSGYETFVKELAERLVKKNIDVTVYCHKNLFNDYPRKLNGINLVYIPTIEKKSLSQFLHSFQSFLHAIFKKYDIILVVNSANGPFGIITKLFGIKTAINVDGLEWLRPKWKGIGSKYFYFASKMAATFYDVIITDSVVMAEIYKSEFHCDSVVISYGADVQFSNNPDIIKFKWNLVKNEYYLVVGRLIPDNNADIIIREFLKSCSNKKLVIVGDVPYKDNYANSIKSIKDSRLIFTGYVINQDELSELYLNCFAYIHGHEFGGTNPTMLKAMACGCAIVALDTPFTREMCDNENHAIYFTKEIGCLSNIINTIEYDSSKIEKYKSSARQRIIKYYNWNIITNKYIELFYKLLGNQITRKY